jgi:hypothetical protein
LWEDKSQPIISEGKMKNKYWGILILLIAGFAYAQTEDDAKIAENTGNRSIAGSTCTVTATVDNGGNSYTITFVTMNASTDAEWIYETGFEFPAGWTITAATATNLDASGQDPAVTINGTRVLYTDPDDDCAYGYHWSSNRQFQYDVTVTPVGGIDGAVVAWKLEGDAWGAEPHLVQSASYTGGVACPDATGLAAADDLVLGGGPAASEVPTLGTYSFVAFIAIFAFLGVMFIRKRH